MLYAYRFGRNEIRYRCRFDGAAVADIERDDLHREVLRTQGKLTSHFGYDAVGRRARHAAQRGRAGGELLAKQWQYDAAGDVIQKRDQRYGTTSYRYDPTGRIEQAAGPGLPSEVFRWDAAANLVSSDHPGGYVEYNRLKVFEDKRFEYDAYGRLVRKLSGHGPAKELTLEYDDWNQLKAVVTKDRLGIATTHFEYDAFGRRIRKLNGSYASTDFLWDGMRLVQETYHDRQGEEALTYLYESNSYVPLARIDHGKAAANDADVRDAVYYFHNDVSGLPEELTDAGGELVWQARYKVWGNAVQEEWIAREPGRAAPDHVSRPQNLRFQGEYLDRETGLHYNLFRYYDPDTGRFVTQDPIGLAGGMNLYQYAPNPIRWIDPLGLSPLGEIQQKINSIFESHLPAIQTIDPNATIGYRGSAASGISKAHDPAISRPININDFDVDGFIQSDYLASDPVFTNRRREASRIPGVSEIERSIDSDLRKAFPGLREEPFGFRIFKIHELSELARKGDGQVKIGGCNK
ncbi:RHS repeat-associated core domain-containing protein [Burkholderia ambifaria]|uniref:RHS repeat domain-containing protein n=1 Tax=Burkholderia ambifaria TaxID=152480 RepID=UPI002FDFFC36